MTQVVDYSYSHPAPSTIKSAGYVGAMRYLGNDNPPQPRVITRAEIDSLTAVGLDFGLVWETYADRAGAGFQAGVTDAQRANAMADALGFPAGRPIFYAVDYQATASQVAPYFQGVLSVNGRPAGIYGHYELIESFVGTGVLPYGWQCAAWSGFGVGSGGQAFSPADGGKGRRLSRHACLYQHVGYVLGNSCDFNDVLKPDWGQAGFAGAPIPAPQPPPEEDMSAATFAKFPDKDPIYEFIVVEAVSDVPPHEHPIDRYWVYVDDPEEIEARGGKVRILAVGDDKLDALWGKHRKVGGPFAGQ